MNSIWSLSQDVNFAYKAEVQLSRTPRYSNYRRANQEGGTEASKGLLPTPVGSSLQVPKPTLPDSKMASKPPPSRDSLYHKPGPLKYFRCFQPGHKSNECLNRKQLQLMDGGSEEHSDLPPEPVFDSIDDLQGDDGEFLACIMEKVLLAPKTASPSQRHSLFRTRCTNGGKVCELVIDSGCTENIISSKVVKALQLHVTKHPSSYKIGWVRKGVKFLSAANAR